MTCSQFTLRLFYDLTLKKIRERDEVLGRVVAFDAVWLTQERTICTQMMN